MSAPTIPPQTGLSSWGPTVWLAIGNIYAWGFAYFVTFILSMLMPISYLSTACTWAMQLLAYVLTPLFAHTEVSGVLTFFTGTGFTDIETVTAYLISWTMNYTAFYWLTTGIFWWYFYCMAFKLVFVIKHEFWPGNAG